MDMRYFKSIIDGHIFAVGKGQGGEEITEEEYNAILDKLLEKPEDIEGYRWLLTESLEWEKCEMPPATDDISAEDALDIITGEVEL